MPRAWHTPVTGGQCLLIFLSHPELVLRQELHLPEELGAPAETRGDLLVVSARFSPAQDTSLEWTQHVTLNVRPATGMLSEASDAGHPLGAATKPTSDLVIVDAIINEAEDSTLNGPKRGVIRHGLPPVCRSHGTAPSALWVRSRLRYCSCTRL